MQCKNPILYHSMHDTSQEQLNISLLQHGTFQHSVKYLLEEIEHALLKDYWGLKDHFDLAALFWPKISQ